jgi:hypothetical protein
MSFSKPFILYRETIDKDIKDIKDIKDEKDEKDMKIEGNIYLYNFESELNDIEINIEDINLYSLDYSCFSFIDKDGIRKVCHSKSGNVINPLVLKRNKIYQVDTPIYYDFENISKSLPQYNFVNYKYKDISSLISSDLNSENGVLPRYILFGNDIDMFENLKKNIKRIDFVKLSNKYKQYISTLSEVLKFNNSTIPLNDKDENTFLTAVRIHQDLFYQNFHIQEHNGYIHIPPMWANYKIPDSTKGETYDHETIQSNKSLTVSGSFYYGMPNPIKNPSWFSYSYIILIKHDYEKIINYKIIIESSDGLNLDQTTEDPRLYYIGSDPYMYTITTKKNNRDNLNCSLTLSKINKPNCDICMIVEETKIGDLCKENVCIQTNTYNILCEESHKNIIGSSGDCRLLEKNYIPFSHRGNRFIFYMSSPFILYNLNPENPKLCRPIQSSEIISNHINSLKILFDSIDSNKKIIKISQTGPAVQYNPLDDTLYMAPMHVRISRHHYSNYIKDVKDNDWINNNLTPFMNIIMNMYDNGDVILHNDIYLNLLIEFKFEIVDNKIHFNIEKFSNPFMFIYYNQKFMLQFGSSISVNKDKLIFSFGEGDSLCRDVEMDINTVQRSILIHQTSTFNNFNFKPIFIRPKNDENMYSIIASSKTTMKDIIYKTIENNTIEHPQNIYDYIIKLENFYLKDPSLVNLQTTSPISPISPISPMLSYTDLNPPLSNYFTKINNQGGGDCLFYSFGIGLFNNSSFETASQIRQQIYNYDYNPIYDMINPIPKETLEFIRLGSIAEENAMGIKMNSAGVWGTEYEIFKASKLFDIPILVYTNNPSNTFNTSCINRNKLEELYRYNLYSYFPGLVPYFSDPLFSSLNPYLTCVYLPNNASNKFPLILYNTNNSHYQVLMPLAY